MANIDRAQAIELENRFGSLQPPLNLHTDGIKAWEREGNSSRGRPLMHPKMLTMPDDSGRFPNLRSTDVASEFDIGALERGEKKYIWLMDEPGRVRIGEMQPAQDPLTGEQRHRGHPVLVAGQPARIGGELEFDRSTNRVVLTDRSGRYSRYEDRPADALDGIAGMFRQAGIDPQIQKVAKYGVTKPRSRLVYPRVSERAALATHPSYSKKATP